MDQPKDLDVQNELARLSKRVKDLEREKEFQGDEIRALKVETRSYQDELKSQSAKVQKLERQILQDAPAINIGIEVRLRYLELHRNSMGKRRGKTVSIGKEGDDRIMCGNRAAHRGRPVVDAIICSTGLIPGGVYQDLYGVRPETMADWRDVPEIIQVTGFHASLQSEGNMTDDFRLRFKSLLQVAKTYSSTMQLGKAFKEDKTLQLLQHELQVCYDKSPRRRLVIA